MNQIRRVLSLALAMLLCGAAAVLPAKAALPAGEGLAERNLFWPEDRLFPAVCAPEEPLVAFPGDLFPAEEMLALASLQGFANAASPRAVILDGDVREWLEEYGFASVTATRENAYGYIKALAENSVAGAVLYSTQRSREYMNLAASVGNTMSAVPMTEEVYEAWRQQGVALPVLADLRDLPYTRTADIYRWLYDNYWQRCSHRILTVQRTDLPWHIRDLAAATGGAVVYLSSTDREETKLLKQFLNDMTPGKSILIGWYAGQEKELMSVASRCGLSCVPADFFCNPTVFAQDLPVNPPAVPDMPAPENKIYVAYFLSDGDNIQYNMHAMRGYWNENRAHQGQVAVNWTVSPALADIAPGILNYYYGSATEKECFVCGPSGMGYAVPVNTFGEYLGNQFPSNAKFRAYTAMTNRYLQRTGLRAVTVWDNLSPAQRRIYAEEGTYLYGLTVQHFTDASLKRRYTGVTDDMLFMQMTPAYFASNPEGTTPLTQIENDVKDAVDYHRFDGSAPVFVAAQASVWAFHHIDDVIRLEPDLSDHYKHIYGEDVVEFVRADHFFNLFYETHGLPLDVTLKPELSAAATGGGDAMLTADGVCAAGSLWTAEETGPQSVTYSLGGTYTLKEIALYHAGAAGLDASLNTKAFTAEVSEDGETWTTVAEIADNADDWNDLTFRPVKGAFLRVTVADPGADGTARIADVDIYGVPEAARVRCPLCGRIHQENFFDRIAGLFHRILYYMTHLPVC